MTRMLVSLATKACVLRLWRSPELRRKLSPLVQYTLKGGKVWWLGSAVAVLVTISEASAAAITVISWSGLFTLNIPLFVCTRPELGESGADVELDVTALHFIERAVWVESKHFRPRDKEELGGPRDACVRGEWL